MLQLIKEVVAYLEKRGVEKPEIGIILGTGLGNLFVKEIKNAITINYNSIPHSRFRRSSFTRGN